MEENALARRDEFHGEVHLATVRKVFGYQLMQALLVHHVQFGLLLPWNEWDRVHDGQLCFFRIGLGVR